MADTLVLEASAVRRGGSSPLLGTNFKDEIPNRCALLAQELGEKKAKIFLNAHEEDSTQSQAEKQMDLANNESGLRFYKKYENNIDLEKIEKEALTQLRQKKLKVIESRYREIPGGYYSK